MFILLEVSDPTKIDIVLRDAEQTVREVCRGATLTDIANAVNMMVKPKVVAIGGLPDGDDATFAGSVVTPPWLDPDNENSDEDEIGPDAATPLEMDAGKSE